MGRFRRCAPGGAATGALGRQAACKLTHYPFRRRFTIVGAVTLRLEVMVRTAHSR